VLEAVGVEVAGVERGVGLHVVVELDDLYVQPIALGDLLDHLPDLGIRSADRADTDGLLLGRDAAGGDETHGGHCCRQTLDERHAHRVLKIFWLCGK
jgi:hypothetical protein